MFKKEIRASIWAIFLLSLGGLMLHLKYHPVDESAFHWLPAIFGGLGVLVLPFLFNSRRTVALAYLINLAAVIAGTIAMAYESWEVVEEMQKQQQAITLEWVVFGSLLKDIIILLAKVPLGHQILRHFRLKGEATA